MNDAPLFTPMVASSRSGTCAPAGVGDEDVADLLRRLAILRLEPNDEIERALTLHDLRGRGAAHGRFDQAVHVGDVDAIARDLVAIDVDGEDSAVRAPARA